MAIKGKIYECEICGNVVEVIFEGQGDLVCCGQPMKLKEEKTEEKGFGEKHLPVIEGKKVKVGSEPHPMEKLHYIEWIEASDGNKTERVFLFPENAPEAEFCFAPRTARISCNLHGLWRKG